MKWQRKQTDRFLIQTWSDEYSANAFDSLSGSTHYLSALSMELIDQLSREPMSIKDMAAACQDAFDVPSEAPGRIQVELSRLQMIGMVIAVPEVD